MHRLIPGQGRHVRSRLQSLFESEVGPVDPEGSFMMFPDSSFFVPQFFFCPQGLYFSGLRRWLYNRIELFVDGGLRKSNPQ